MSCKLVDNFTPAFALLTRMCIALKSREEKLLNMGSDVVHPQ